MQKNIVSKNYRPVTTIIPMGSEPYTITVIKSGWKYKYHVIVEWGESREVTHKILKDIELLEQYGIDICDLPLTEDKVTITRKQVLSLPNDMDLGACVRKLI